MAKHAVRSGSHLARELKIPPPTINRIIAGQVLDPRCSTLVLLADYFDVSIDQLVGREEIDWSKYQ